MIVGAINKQICAQVVIETKTRHHGGNANMFTRCLPTGPETFTSRTTQQQDWISLTVFHCFLSVPPSSSLRDTGGIRGGSRGRDI